MLNKNICKKCFEVCGIKWTDFDESRWDRSKLIWCPQLTLLEVKQDSRVHRLVDPAPPVWCTYKLEQAISATALEYNA